MFEKFLENLLNQYLGTYIDGFDTKNLSLWAWSGNVEIQNVFLKPEAIKLSELPIKLIYSSIGNLSLSIPWKNLSTQPLEIILSKVYLVIAPEKKSDWTFQDFKNLQKKTQDLEAFFQKYIKQLMEIQKNKVEEKQGYTQKMMIKILDNIQITIKSIHIRFENENEINQSAFSLGISLKQLNIVTTDENWTEKFIDRTNSEIPMRKLLKLRDLDLYWIFKKPQLIKTLTEGQNTFLENFKAEQQELILSLSADMKFIQTKSPDFSIPENQLSIDLKNIDLNLDRIQMQQVIQLAEFFSMYQMQFEKKKCMASKLSEEQLQNHEKNFTKILKQRYGTTEKAIPKEAKNQWEEILICCDIDTLVSWSKPVLKDFSLAQSLNQASSSSVWGWLGYSKNSKNQEQEKIEKFFKDLQEDSLKEVKVQNYPKEYVWFHLSFTLNRGSIQVSQQGDNKVESVKITFDKLVSELNQREKNMVVDLSLETFYVDSIDNINGQSKVVNFMKQENEKQKFITFEFDKYPLLKHNDEVVIDQSIKLLVQPSIIKYDNNMIQRLGQIFKLQTNDDLKQQTWDQIDQTLDNQSKKLKEAIDQRVLIKVDVSVFSPVIYLPIDEEKDEFWIVNFGNLLFQTHESCLTKAYENSQYDTYKVQLNTIKMDYKLSNKVTFVVIDEFDIQTELGLVKQNQSGTIIYTENTSQVVTTGNLSRFRLNLSNSIYGKLLKMGKIFEQEAVQEVKKDTRQSLIQNAKKIGEIYLKTGMKEVDWVRYQGLFNSGYIHFFADSKSKYPVTQHYVRNSLIKPVETELLQNVYSVQNRYTNIMIAFEKPELAASWIKTLQSQNSSNVQEISRDQTMAQVNPNQIQLTASFVINSMNLRLKDEKNKTIVEFSSSYLQFGVVTQMYEQKINLKLGQIVLEEYIRSYVNEELNYFIRSKESDDGLIQVGIQIKDKKSPNYQGTLMRIDAYFGSLMINYKCETMKFIMNFIQVEQDPIFIEPKKLEIASKDSQNTSLNTSAQSRLSQKIFQFNKKKIIQKQEEETLMRFNLQLNLIQVTLVNELTYLPQTQIQLNNGNILLNQQEFQNTIHIILGNFSVFDLSNYPKTLLKEEEYTQIKKKELFKVGQKDDTLDILVKQYQKALITDCTAMEVSIQTSTIKIIYAQQPVLRMLDLINGQIMPSLGDGKVVQLTKSQSEKDVQNYEQMRLTILLKTIDIDVEGYKDTLNLRVGEVSIGNKMFQEMKGDIEVWVQRFEILLKDMQLNIKNTESYQICQRFDYYISVDMLMFPDQYVLLNPGKQVDTTMHIKSRILPIIIRLSRDNYLQLMSVLNQSISYDDLLDRYLITQYEQKQQQGGDMKFQLDIDNISIFTLDTYNVPFSKISFDKFRINFDKIGTIALVSLQGLTLSGTYFEEENNSLYEGPLLGSLATSNTYDLQNLHTIYTNIEKNHDQQIVFSFTDFPESIKKEFSLNMEMQPNGNKFIKIALDNLTINLYLQHLMTLANFGGLDESCNPDNPELYLQEKNIDIPVKIIGSNELRLAIGITNPILVLSARNQQQCLATRGEIHVTVDMTPPVSYVQILKEIKEQVIPYEETYDLNKLMRVEVFLTNLEVFICDFNDLSGSSLRQVYKRNLFNPFSLFFNMKSYLQLNEEHFFVNRTDFNVNIEPANIQISMMNLGFIQGILNYQMEKMSQPTEKKAIEAKEFDINLTDPKQKYEQLIKNKEKGEIIDINNSNFHVYLHQVQIQMINDAEDAVPVLDIQISSTQLDQNVTLGQSQVKAIVNLQLSYFNPQKSRWEPVLEPMAFNLELLQNEYVYPKFIMKIAQETQNTKYVNITISTQFLNVLIKLLNTIQEKIKKKEKKVAIEIEGDNIVKVSPYKIYNLTGYPILVQRDFTTQQKANIQNIDHYEKMLIKNTDKINYQIESELEDMIEQVAETDLQNQYVIKFEIDGESFARPGQVYDKINLDRVKISRQSIKTTDLERSFRFYTSVDIIDDRKVLTISSGIIFNNLSSLPLSIYFPALKKNLPLIEDSLTPVPIDNILEHINIQYESHFSNVLQLQKMHTSQDFVYEILLDTRYLLLKSSKLQNGLGATQIEIIQPYKIHNKLPFKLTLHLQNKNQESDVLVFEPNTCLETMKFSSKQSLYGTIIIDNYKSPTFLMKHSQIQLNAWGAIDLMSSVDLGGEQEFCFYLQGYVESNLEYDMKFLYASEAKGEKHYLEAGKVLQDSKFLYLECDHTQSKKINIAGLENDYSEIQTSKGILEVAVTVELIQHQVNLFTKKVNVNPKFVVVNEMDFPIVFRQSETNQNLICPSKQRTVYFWHSSTVERLVQISFDTNSQGQKNWSGKFDFNQGGQLGLVIRDQKNKQKCQYLQVNTTIYNRITYIKVSPYLQGQEMYTIQNQTELELSYFQKDNQSTLLPPNETHSFGLDQPMKEKSLVLEYKVQNQRHSMVVSLEDINKTLQMVDTAYVIRTSLDGQTRKVVILHLRQSMIQSKESQKFFSVINLKFNKMGISLIQNYNEIVSKEVLFITLKDCEFVYCQTPSTNQYQFRLRYLNIDNNSKFISNYPVFFTPSSQYQTKNEKNESLINILIEMDSKATNCLIFNKILIDLDPMTIRLDEALLDSLSTFSQKMSVALDQQTQITENPHWSKVNLPPQASPIFIGDLLMSPLNFRVTFKSESKSSKPSKFMLLQILLKSIGTSVINFEDAEISLKGFKQKNCMDTPDNLIKKILLTYQGPLMFQLLKLLGSFDLIGNPVGLINTIGTGFQDLINKPKEGFVQGPLEGGIGIFQGVGSLLSNTVSGTFNTLGKITGSLGTGIAGLSMDDEYLKRRTEMKAKKAKNVGQGLQQAGLSLFTGFEKGITGLLTKPIDGIKKQGAKGFFKGTLQGLSGLVLKPVTGILDATSKTTEGIKNMAQMNDDKPNEVRESNFFSIGMPRTFYGPEKFYKKYLDSDASAFQILQQLNNFKYQDRFTFLGICFMVDSHLIVLQKNVQKLFIITMEFLILVDLKKIEQEWEVKPQDISGVVNVPDGLNVITKNKQIKKITLLNEQQQKIVYDRLLEIMDIATQL